jgi:hypothetical protein
VAKIKLDKLSSKELGAANAIGISPSAKTSNAALNRSKSMSFHPRFSGDLDQKVFISSTPYISWLRFSDSIASTFKTVKVKTVKVKTVKVKPVTI